MQTYVPLNGQKKISPTQNLASELKGTLAQCGLINTEVGHTYLAGRLSMGGEINYTNGGSLVDTVR